MTPRLPLIALDRDGTLIREGDYLKNPDKVRLLSGVPENLQRLKQAGYNVVVISNQSGVGRGILTLREMKQVHRRFVALLKRHRVKLDGYFFCVHHPDQKCSCRKPNVGLLRQAAKKLHRPWKGTISVGDRPSDVQLGQRAGGKGVLVLTGYGRRWRHDRTIRPDYIATNFRKAVDWILK